MVVSISTTEKRKVIKEGSIGFLLNVGARASEIFFLENFYVFAFQGHLKPSKGNEQGSEYRLLQ